MITIKRIYPFTSILICVLLVISCHVFDDDGNGYNDNNYSFTNLDYEDLFYVYGPSYYDINEPFLYEADSNGVIISDYYGSKYYNPVTISQKGINLFDRYRKKADSLYLDYALRHRDALVNLMDEQGYLEYRQTILHFSTLLLKPWYSGMSQGQALSLLSRLAFFTNDTLSENMAHKVFETLNPFSEVSNEVVFIDSLNYVWIEEYPEYPPYHTFNGFMFAIIGIYDYYNLLKTDDATKEILSIYLTTIHDLMHEYRNPGDISRYCLGHTHKNETYHRIHIIQLEYFTEITQDSSFAKFADTLRMDYWNY